MKSDLGTSICWYLYYVPMISLASMLPSIEEKPAATAAGWANGCAFVFGAWVLVVEFGPGFGGLVFARRVHRASLL